MVTLATLQLTTYCKLPRSIWSRNANDHVAIDHELQMTTLQLTTLQLTMWCNVYKQTFFLFAREGEKSLHSLSSGMLPKKESNRMTGRRLGVRLLNVQDSIDPRSLLQGRTTNTIAYLAKKKISQHHCKTNWEHPPESSTKHFIRVLKSRNVNSRIRYSVS